MAGYQNPRAGKSVSRRSDSRLTDLHHRFRDLVGWEVMEGAGMTEIGCHKAANPRYGQRKWSSLGLSEVEPKATL